jgi:hypothetical protein
MAQTRSDTRGIKLLISSTFIIIASFMIYPGFFSRRTRGDEANLAIDIYRLLQEGSVLNFSYGHGQAFLTFVTTILNILGLPYSATNELSPFIAALCLSAMVAFLYFVYRGESGDWLGVIAITAGFFPFAAFIGVLSETSHKAFIYTIVLMSFYLTWQFYRKEYDGRQLVLLVGILCVLSFINVFWAMVYSGTFIFALIVEGVVGGRINELRSFMILPATTVLTIILFLPTVPNTFDVLYVRVKRLFAESTTTSTTVSTGGLISEWPTMHIFSYEISMWFLYTVGIFIIATISAGAFTIAIYRLMRGKTRPIDKLLTVIFPIFGLIMLGMLGAGSLPAFRRLMVFPGVIGLLYWMSYLSRNRNPISSPNRYTIIAIATVAIICLSAFIAIPRLTPDGHNNPYDKFSDDSDISRVSFALQNQYSECLFSSNNNDINTAKVVFGKQPPFERPLPSPDSDTYHKIYSSDTNNALFC